ncbi:hypothetical protein SDA16_06760 [Legionella pneumophila serogroup 1]|nr:hypothetical protein [Legionella pneumophila]HAU9854069.1 hypothetical protein [Legionella pneumophila]HAU9907330.1 hypothetical protein [Legionella pneumophila]HAV0028518.1 hypothetical protein [Legionella pneumophila]HCC3235804.1 hypothetical protein [Legionella pneumophila subsp. pneumophila]
MKAKKNNNKTRKQAEETINICKVKPRYITLNEDIFQSLNPYTLKLYLAMRYESDYSIECSSIKKNIKFLENKTNLSRRQILYSLKELEGFGLVKRERESGYQSTYWTAQDMGYFLPAIEEKKDNNDGENNDQPSQDMHGVVHNMHEDVQDVHGVVHNMHDIINNIFINLFKYIYIPDSYESGKNEKNFSNFKNEDHEVIIENQSLIEKEKSDYFDNQTLYIKCS